jgi:hypothetical protein
LPAKFENADMLPESCCFFDPRAQRVQVQVVFIHTGAAAR